MSRLSRSAPPPSQFAHDVRMYCIALRDTPRADALREELEKHDLHRDVEWVLRDRDAEDGIRGCYESHQAVAEAFVNTNGSVAVVFEDDVVFEHARGMTVVQGIQDAVNAVRGGASVCGIGGIAVAPFGPHVESSVRCRYAKWRWTHAYAMSRAAAVWIQNTPYARRHYDVVLGDVVGRTALLCPAVAFQRGGCGTTTGASALYRFLSFLRDAVGARRCQKTMEALMRACGVLCIANR